MRVVVDWSSEATLAVILILFLNRRLSKSSLQMDQIWEKETKTVTLLSQVNYNVCVCIYKYIIFNTRHFCFMLFLMNELWNNSPTVTDTILLPVNCA